MFLKENMNPKGWKCGDCVIRACAKATNKSWDDTYQALYEIGFKKKRLPNDPCVFEKFLFDNGFEYHKQMKDSYGNKMTVAELANYYKDGNYVLAVHTRKHLTCILLGDIIDSWNTSYEIAGYYYIKELEV